MSSRLVHARGRYRGVPIIQSDTDHPLDVLVADRRTLVREGLILLIERFTGVHASAGAGSFGAVERYLAASAPDVVLIDAGLPGWNGFDLNRLRVRYYSKAVFLVLCADQEVHDVCGLLQRGAAGILLRDAEPRVLENAIHTAAAGSIALCPSATGMLFIESIRRAGVDQEPPWGEDDPTVTGQVITFLRKGKTASEIARAIGLSRQSVENHINRAMLRFGIQDTDHMVHALLSMAPFQAKSW